MQITDTTPQLGLGCWPLSGAFYAEDRPLGYANADPSESIRALEAAYGAGIRLFDTAAVYGAGKGERLVGEALNGKTDVTIVTKIGLAFDEDTEMLLGEELAAGAVLPAIDRCLKRLGRDHVDVVLIHPNEAPVDQADAMFDEMERAVASGRIGSFGWSTDFPDNVRATADRDSFSTVEYAMNVFFDVPSIRRAVDHADCWGLVRSPLAMGLLSGKTAVSRDDIRAHDEGWNNYYVDGAANPIYTDQIAALRDLLQTGGRSLVQGALGWVMAKGPRCIPLPGARTVAQVTENAKALEFGPLPKDIMTQIEALMDRPPEGPPRSR